MKVLLNCSIFQALRMWGNHTNVEAALCVLLWLDITLFIAFLIYLFLSKNLFGIENNDKRRKFHAVWDLDGLTDELLEEVSDQENVLSRIKRIVKVMTANKNLKKTVECPQYQIIFLVGGPGVGKTHILDILKKHFVLKSSNFNSSVITPKFTSSELRNNLKGKYCYLTNRQVTGFTFSYSDLSTSLEVFMNDKNNKNLANELMRLKELECKQDLEYSFFDFLGNLFNPDNSYQNIKSINDNFIHFVTGSIISDSTLCTLKNDSEYEAYVDDIALRLKQYMMLHVPNLNVDTITFKPVLFDDFMDEKEGRFEGDIDDYKSRGFMPWGYKTL